MACVHRLQSVSPLPEAFRFPAPLINPPSCLPQRRRTEGRNKACVTAATVSQATEDSEYVCKFCNAKGWMICDFCNGQKTNVQVRNNRIYRRCPSCKAAGVVICPECKVYKCVTFPDGKDGGFDM